MSSESFAALTEGTNCGFVTAAPVVDPEAVDSVQLDTYAWANKFTSPADIDEVTEMGVYVNANPGSGPDFEMGIYADDAGDSEPGVLVDKSTAGALSAGVGWKTKAGLSISLTGSTVYWLAVQCDNDVGGAINQDKNSNAAYPSARHYQSLFSLPDPWGDSSGSFDGVIAMYAVYTTTAGARRIIMIE